MTSVIKARGYALNAVCPYFTMFPLDFPQGRLRRHIAKGCQPVVLDVFCGRGTTLYAARAAGTQCYGIDTSPVAVAIARAKLAHTSLPAVLRLAESLLQASARPHVPEGEFWMWAYHQNTLRHLCRLRQGLQHVPESGAACLLRAIALGALHGPLPKRLESAAYFSNQMPRTYASKPGYSVRYWRDRNLFPPEISVLEVIRRRAERIFSEDLMPRSKGSKVLLGDSRDARLFRSLEKVNLVITSPPYFGMKTYIPDQWLRNWFLGGPPMVTYDRIGQIAAGSASDFSSALAEVWDNVGDVAAEDLKIAVRFGGIQSRRADPAAVLRESFQASRHRWKLISHRPVSSVRSGRRQADQMRVSGVAMQEFDTTWRFA